MSAAQIEAERFVADTIAKSQNENRIVVVGDNYDAKVRDKIHSALERECDRDCDSGEYEYWGSNEHGEWRVHVLAWVAP